MNKMNRRTFIQQSGSASLMAGAFIKSVGARSSPNDTINIAVMGIHGRGGALMEGFAGLPNVNVATICDIDENLFPKALSDLEKVCGKRAKTETDIRRVLENKNIDAIAVAAPNHWHALATIWGCQAGKDVYVEKPVSWSITEGRRMIEAARKYERIVQTGTQNRSLPLVQSAVDYLHAGKLADDSAEVQVEGTLLSISSTPLVATPGRLPNYRVNIVVALKLMRGPQQLNQVVVSGGEEFPSGADLLWAETWRGAAIRRVAEAMMREGAERLANGW